MKFSVQSLRRQGYKVRVIHARPYFNSGVSLLTEPLTRFVAEDVGMDISDVSPTGGETMVQITTPSGEEFEAKAVCSNSQQFYRKLGTYIAIGRALGEHPTEQDFLKELKAKKIVDKLLWNLHSRREVGASLDNVCQEVYSQMEEELVNIVKGQL